MLGIEQRSDQSENQLRLNAVLAYSTLLARREGSAKRLLPRGSRVASASKLAAANRPAPVGRPIAKTRGDSSRQQVSQLFDIADGLPVVHHKATVTKQLNRGTGTQAQHVINVIPVHSLSPAKQAAPPTDAGNNPHTKLLSGDQQEEDWSPGDAWDDFNEDEQYDVNAGWKQQASVAEHASDQADTITAAGSNEQNLAGDTPGAAFTVESGSHAETAAVSDNEDTQQEWQDAFQEEGLFDEEPGDAEGASEERDEQQHAPQPATEPLLGGFSSLLQSDDMEDDHF